VGFSRGAAEAVDFGNLVTNALNAGTLTYTRDGYEHTCYQGQITIRFIGLYDMVTTINAQPGNPGLMNATLPKGVGLVAHAVALSEERQDFEWTDLSQLNPNGDQLVQLGFRGAHSDIGGDAVDPGTPDVLTAVTLNWMNTEAQSVGWNTLDPTLETINQYNKQAVQQAVATPAAYNAQPVNQIYTRLGGLFAFNLQYRNFGVIDPNLQCWLPGIADLQHMPLYTSQGPQFWDPNFLQNLVWPLPQTPVQTQNGA
jgi:hypothetical protein